jgi:hypothetical protein
MSALGQKRKSPRYNVMSVLLSRADIASRAYACCPVADAPGQLQVVTGGMPA